MTSKPPKHKPSNKPINEGYSPNKDTLDSNNPPKKEETNSSNQSNNKNGK